MRVGWVVVLAAACGGEPSDKDRIRAVLRLEGDPENGELVYAELCVSCHGADGSGEDGTLVGADIRGLEADIVADALVVPPSGMLTFDTVPDQDLADVIAHVAAL
jgi:mono/diheme cytochrome c family protein